MIGDMKIFIAVAASLTMLAGIVALFTTAVVGRKLEWCPLPCANARASCDSPFDPNEVCSEIQRAAYDHGEPAPQWLWIKFTEATISGKRGFRDSFGRSVAGIQTGALGVEVAYLPTDDKPCQTALRHEVRHAMLDGKKDPNHRLPKWEVFDGCAKSP